MMTNYDNCKDMLMSVSTADYIKMFPINYGHEQEVVLSKHFSVHLETEQLLFFQQMSLTSASY